MSVYSALTVEKLKTQLRCRGASTRGRKIDLIERLESYDRNQNFCQTEEEQRLPDPVKFHYWPVTGFQQLLPSHKDTVPPTTKADVEAYFRYRMAVDNEERFQGFREGGAMYKCLYILACSVKVEGDAYLTGLVNAAMKKKVSYSFKVKLGAGGDIVNTHCECPAGKGPHGTCKHLAAVLLMISDFKTTGVVSIRKSCTDRLQTFHRPPKEYSGSPKKASSFSRGTKRTDLFEDPRPAKYRNTDGYRDHVRNATINFCSTSSKDVTLRYLFGRANLSEAAQDHDYLDRLFTEYWVDTALKITDEEAEQLEKRTRQQSKCLLWHEERKWRLTASKFGCICKCTMRRDKDKLCKNIISCKKIVSKPLMHGIQYEPRAISKLELVCNLKVAKCGMFVNPEFPYLAATPDGVIDCDTIVEVKCPYSARNEAILPGKKFPYLYNNLGQINLKETSCYYFQVQGQMFLSKRKYCLFAVYTFKDFFVQKIYFDEEYCTGSLIPKLSLFFECFLRPYIACHCIC